MNKTKKKEDKCDKVVGKLLQQLTEAYPDTAVDRIHALTTAMKIQFKVLSFANCPAAVLEKYGKGQIDYVHEELEIYANALRLDLLKMWKEDKKERKKE